MDAPTLFAELLRGEMNPALRKLGFRGSGGIFSLRNDGAYALLGFQKDKWNNSARCRFTINTTFVGHQTWEKARVAEPWLPSKPSPNVDYLLLGGFHDRVGYLMEPAHDHWWAIRHVDDAQVVGQDVVETVRTWVLPQLLSRLERVEPPPLPQPVDESRFRCPWPYCTEWQSEVSADA